VVYHHAATNDYLNTGITNQNKRSGMNSDYVSSNNNMAQGEYIVEETNNNNT
jgi:hypothetical protein